VFSGIFDSSADTGVMPAFQELCERFQTLRAVLLFRIVTFGGHIFGACFKNSSINASSGIADLPTMMMPFAWNIHEPNLQHQVPAAFVRE